MKCHAVAELQVFVNYVILLHPPEHICITPADVSAQEFTFYFSNFFLEMHLDGSLRVNVA